MQKVAQWKREICVLVRGRAHSPKFCSGRTESVGERLLKIAHDSTVIHPKVEHRRPGYIPRARARKVCAQLDKSIKSSLSLHLFFFSYLDIDFLTAGVQ